MNTSAGLFEMPHGVSAIDAHYVAPGLAASHLICHQGRAAFVDTGTTHSVPRLLRALQSKGIERDQVDYVLLTHVHLDHAGGAGALLQSLPFAKAVLHPRGAPHIISPAKLVAGAKAVYGDEAFGRLYGEIVPVDAQRVSVVEDGDEIDLAGRRLEFIHTAGHALHHYCIVDHDAKAVFSGDSFGVSYRALDTERGEFIFPTTTPVQFDPEAAHESIDRIIGFRPESIYLAHFSRVTDVHRLAADLHADIDVFVAIALEAADRTEPLEAIAQEMFAYLGTRLDAHGFAKNQETRHALLDMDMQLNAQGLNVWLQRRAKKSR